MAIKFILLSSQRTGSAFLEQSINSHPNIKCNGEVLLGYGGSYKKMPPKFLKSHRRLRTLWQAIFSGAMLRPVKTMEDSLSSDSGDSAVGFRLMYNQIERDSRVRGYIGSVSDIKVIHLRRRDLLKQFVSLKLMHDQSKHGRFSAHVYESPEPVRIEINPREAVEYVKKIKLQQRQYHSFLSHFDSITVDYEDMVSDAGVDSAVSDSICDFLAVSKESLSTSQVKVNPSRLEDIVINYSELISYIKECECGDLVDIC